MHQPDYIEMALGKKPVDMLLKDARLVNVVAGEIHPASIAIHGDRVVGFGDYEALETVDLAGRFVTPGLIDGHMHLESSMLSAPEFARNVVPLGTTAVVADPHEIANVLGLRGIRYLLETSENIPLRVFVMFPSCVPATPFETSGATLTAEDMKSFKDHPRILGLAEVMNFPGVIGEDPDLLAKIDVFKDEVIDGHAPGLTGMDLNAYLSAGIGSDHECTSLEEAREKLRKGMRIMIRQGSAAKNLDSLLPLVNEFNSGNCLFVTDDIDPADIEKKGHINGILRLAVDKGVDPIRAVQMVTLNPARYFRLKRLGAVVPGNLADLAVFDDLKEFEAHSVYRAGKLVARNGKTVVPCELGSGKDAPPSINVDWEKVGDLTIDAAGEFVNVIRAVPGEIFTKREVEKAPVSNGRVVADPERDILKIAVIERHSGTGSHSVALIRGFGLKRGAIACTVAHDSHNIIVVAADDRDMLLAAKEAAGQGGGMTVVEDGTVRARLPLPIAGLMSDGPLEEVRSGLNQVAEAAQKLGCTLESPFATLSFMALTPIPEIKITDQGLFDSVNFAFMSLFEPKN
jgi:adenine deaminase